MKQRFLIFLICLCLIFGLASPVLAEEFPRVVDEAGLLTEAERTALEEKAVSYWDSCQLDVVILTVDSTFGESVQRFADDYYDQNLYGYAEDYSGILLLLCMDTREWYFSTCGEGIYIFTDYGLEQMVQEIIPYLSSGDYYGAFDIWLDTIPAYVERYRNGSPIDSYVPPDDYSPVGGEDVVYYERDLEPNHLVSLLIGAAVAAVAILCMVATMNTAKQQSNAVDYLKQGSFHMHVHRDLFLYRRTKKTAKPQNTGGGGSSVHRSSGGRSHGGRGGRF